MERNEKRPQSGKRCSRAAPLHGRQPTAALWGRNITPPAPGSGSGRPRRRRYQSTSTAGATAGPAWGPAAGTARAGRLVGLSARRPARTLLYLYRRGGRHSIRDGRPLRPDSRRQRPAEHDFRRAPHRPARLEPRPPGHRPGLPPDGVGGQRPRLLARPGLRRSECMAGQIHGLYPEGDHPFFRRHLPHLPRLSQAAGSGLCAADAYLRLRQCGREPPPHPAV